LAANEVLISSVRTFDPPENIARSVRNFDNFKRLFQLIFLTIVHFPSLNPLESDSSVPTVIPATILETVFEIPSTISQSFDVGRKIYHDLVYINSKTDINDVKELETLALKKCLVKTREIVSNVSNAKRPVPSARIAKTQELQRDEPREDTTLPCSVQKQGIFEDDFPQLTIHTKKASAQFTRNVNPRIV
jgi:hypothetical protein